MLRSKIEIENYIDRLSQDELRFDTDNITNDGWDFIENKAPKICLAMIETMAKNGYYDMNAMEESDVKTEFEKAIKKTPCVLRDYSEPGE